MSQAEGTSVYPHYQHQSPSHPGPISLGFLILRAPFTPHLTYRMLGCPRNSWPHVLPRCHPHFVEGGWSQME